MSIEQRILDILENDPSTSEQILSDLNMTSKYRSTLKAILEDMFKDNKITCIKFRTPNHNTLFLYLALNTRISIGEF